MYQALYTDENGKSRTVTISKEDSVEAIKNDCEVLLKKFNKKRVEITEIPPAPGMAKHFLITVKAPTHYLSGSTDFNPKKCEELSFHLEVYFGYPLVKVKAYYPVERRLASINVFSNGNACIGDWKVYKSSVLTVVEKMVHDIIHDPAVANADSKATSYLTNWWKKELEAGKFPTIPSKELYADDNAPRLGAHNPPPLPIKRRKPELPDKRT